MKLRRKKQKVEFNPRRQPPAETSPAVFSYYARGSSNNNQNTGRNELDSRRKYLRSYKKLAYVPSYIALGTLLIAAIYSCWLQPNPKLVIVSKAGTVSRSSQEYQSGIMSLWRRSILNHTKLTVHSANIKNDILTQYGELSDVQIELPLIGRRPTIVLTPSAPVFQFISSNGAFYVNAQGKVMARAAEVMPNQLSSVPLVRDETGIPADISKNILPETGAKFLQKLSAQLMLEGISIDSITLPSTAANEADVRITGQPYYIKFSMLSDPQQSVGTYQVVKAKLETDHASPKEYIDVRVDEKVFYK